MKTLLRLLLGLCVSASLTARVFAESDEPKRSPEEIEKLVAPIALYPDSLIALILPASTTSADIVLAARFLSFGGYESDIDKQFWSESVKSLAHYPTVVKWMDENLAWTQLIGMVFVDQPTDVMNAIQRLRVHARATGLLTDTPQQRVVAENDVIYIVPARANTIYVPYYDSDILWRRYPHSGSYISFGVGFGVGSWLYYDCDWPGRTIWVHHRHNNWAYSPHWRPPPPAVRVSHGTTWYPRSHYGHTRPPMPPPGYYPRPTSHPRPSSTAVYRAPQHNNPGYTHPSTPPPSYSGNSHRSAPPTHHTRPLDRPRPPSFTPPPSTHSQPPPPPQMSHQNNPRAHQGSTPTARPPSPPPQSPPSVSHHGPSRTPAPTGGEHRSLGRPTPTPPPAATPPAPPPANSDNSGASQPPPPQPRMRGR